MHHPLISIRRAPVAQLDRASDYGSEGLKFESSRVRTYEKAGFVCQRIICLLPLCCPLGTRIKTLLRASWRVPAAFLESVGRCGRFFAFLDSSIPVRISRVVDNDFEWDDQKSIRNKEKHGIDFSEARNLWKSGVDEFPSPRGVQMRYVAFGTSQSKLWIVALTYVGMRRRLISARETTPEERSKYEGQKKLKKGD